MTSSSLPPLKAMPWRAALAEKGDTKTSLACLWLALNKANASCWEAQGGVGGEVGAVVTAVVLGVRGDYEMEELGLVEVVPDNSQLERAVGIVLLLTSPEHALAGPDHVHP